jgi:hypothetical protein
MNEENLLVKNAPEIPIYKEEQTDEYRESSYRYRNPLTKDI